ncbi:MAG TPA: hypothetical protein VF272_03235, partial [Candidatus Saccharimonadia bacterium]
MSSSFLSIIRIIAVVVILLSIYGLVTASGLFGIGGDFFSSSEQKAAEGNTGNVDAIGGILSAGLGMAWLIVSLITFCLSLIVYFVATRKLKKQKQLLETKVDSVSPPRESQPETRVGEESG